jgi:hypothetical protein
MKKIILFVFLVFFTLGAFSIGTVAKSNSENNSNPDKRENKMSDEEINSMIKRVNDLRVTDNSPQTIIVQEGHKSQRGNNGWHGNNRRHSSVVFVGGGSVLLLIILLIVLV